jgi:hypothetical protein
MNVLKKNVLALGFLFSLMFIFNVSVSADEMLESDGGGYMWSSKIVKCTVTRTYGFDYGIVSTTSETYDGTKKVCVSGSSFCWSGACKA